MAAKYFTFLALAAVVSPGLAVTEIWLADEVSTHITNPWIAKTIGIAQSFLDTLVSCHVIYPNGVLHEAYPEENLPEESIFYLRGSALFADCSIGFLNAPPSLSGTYELLSRVRHSEDNSETLTRKRFHLTFQEISSSQDKIQGRVHPKLLLQVPSEQ